MTGTSHAYPLADGASYIVMLTVTNSASDTDTASITVRETESMLARS